MKIEVNKWGFMTLLLLAVSTRLQVIAVIFLLVMLANIISGK